MDQILADPFTGHQHRPQSRQQLDRSHQRPPQFQVRSTGQDLTTMAELDALRAQTIELKTELRLTREQLRQAQSGTQYLVNCFANQQPRANTGALDAPDQFTLQSRNQQLQTGVHRLRGQLEWQSREKSSAESPTKASARKSWAKPGIVWELQAEVTELKSQRASLLNDVLRLLKEDANDYSFVFDDGDPRIYKPLEHFKDKVAALEQEEPLLDGDVPDTVRRLQSAFDKAAGPRDRVDSPIESATAEVKKHSIFVRPGDESLLDLDPVEQSVFDESPAREPVTLNTVHHWQAADPGPSPRQTSHDPSFGQHPPAPTHLRHHRKRRSGPKPFAPFEHTYLMSNACFIEDKHDDEYFEFWEDLAEEKGRFAGRHTKEEWKAYYVSNVRPLFLQRMAQRGDAAVPKAAEEMALSPVQVKVAGPPEEHADAPTTTANQSAHDVDLPDDSRPQVISIKPQMKVVPSVGEEPAETEPAKADTAAADCTSSEGASKAGSVSGHSAADDIVIDSSIVVAAEPAMVAEGLEASRWAVRKFDSSNTAVAGVRAGSVDTSRTTNHTADVLVFQRQSDRLNAPVNGPAVSNAGAFPRPLSTGVSGQTPGLAGGWPQPVSRNRGRFARHTSAPTSERDPVAWYNLFFSIERRSDTRYVLGKNESLFRTVIIGDVPVGTTLAEVLDDVRGGKIVSAKFWDTAGMRTTPPMAGNTVMVEFVSASSAKAVVEHAAKRAIRFDAGEEAKEADVQLIRTQTLPLHPMMARDLFRSDCPLTRVLFVIFGEPEDAVAPERLARDVVAFARQRAFFNVPKYPLRISLEESGMMTFEYADVRQALAAYDAVCGLEREGRLGEVSKGFAADPCGRPCEQGTMGREGRGETARQGRSEEDEGGSGSEVLRDEGKMESLRPVVPALSIDHPPPAFAADSSPRAPPTSTGLTQVKTAPLEEARPDLESLDY